MRLVLALLVALLSGQATLAQPSGAALGEALASGTVDPTGFDFGAARHAPGQTTAFLAAQTAAQAAVAKAHGKPSYAAMLDAGVCPTSTERLAVAGFDAALLAPDASTFTRERTAANAAFARYLQLRDAILAGKAAPWPEFQPDQAMVVNATRATRPEEKALYLHAARDQLWRHALIFITVPGGYADGVGAAGRIWLTARLGEDGCAGERENDAWLRTTLATVNWFDLKTYGQGADEAAWLIAQHADNDPGLQALALDRIGPLAVAHQSNLEHFAYLWDRVALHDGRPQRYGTQMHCAGKAWLPIEPIEDLKQLNIRRSWAGLPSEAAFQHLGARLCGG